jgi:hypothetical protein
MLRLLVFIAGFALAACQATPTTVSPPGNPGKAALILLPVQAEAVSIQVSGAAQPRPDWETQIARELTLALGQALSNRGIQVLQPGAVTASVPGPLLKQVLPAASRRPRLPTAQSPGHWSLAPLTLGDETVLLVFQEFAPTSWGHKVAEVGLGLAFATPVLPNRGESVTHFALVDGASGDLLSANRLAGTDPRSQAGAATTAERIAQLVAGDIP